MERTHNRGAYLISWGKIELPAARPCSGCISPSSSFTVSTNNDTVCISTTDSIPTITLNGNGNVVFICNTLNLGSIDGFGTDNKIVINPGGKLIINTDFSPYQNLNIIADYGQLNLAAGASNFYAPIVVSNGSIPKKLAVCKTPSAFYTNPFNTNWGPLVTVTDNCVNLCTSQLPLDLLSFTVKENKNSVQLLWVTSNEVQTDRFNIERSGNGRDYITVGTLKSKNIPTTTTHYSFEDNLPLEGNNYYRLKCIDIDANYSFSTVQTINVKQSNKMITTVSDSQVRVRFSGSVLSGQLRLVDMQGRILKQVPIQKDQLQVTFNGSGLSPGHYVVQFINEHQVAYSSLVTFTQY
ncbi:hypothetical protein [Pinibacter aurantiacus]|uniref:T9SS type A sorting domain-containing protein n=1 Tax=Pinibacter aurantiacus TaxID=2851599 RepID=A0A9E2S8C5_9BACT|nr:hypothetical protein [Pinibacter aurantiacus]MBV4355835.1 hypothetical protein [Pinibacter aurantiacus]